MKNDLIENEMKKAMRRVEAFRALFEYLPNHVGERFTVADIRKEYPNASPYILAHYLSDSWDLGVRVKVYRDAAEIKCKPFQLGNYEDITVDSYKVNIYWLISLTR